MDTQKENIQSITRTDIKCPTCNQNKMIDKNPYLYCCFCNERIAWRPNRTRQSAIVSVPGADGESDVRSIQSQTVGQLGPNKKIADIVSDPVEQESLSNKVEHGNSERALESCRFCKQKTLVKTTLGVHCDNCGKNEVR